MSYTCSNALTTRYRLRFEASNPINEAICTVPTANAFITNVVEDIMEIDGLDLGQEGTVETAEWDRKTKVPDGIKVLADVPITFRVRDTSMLPTLPFHFFTMWSRFAHGLCRTMYLEVTDRAWNTLWVYKWTGVTMQGHPKEAAKKLASPEITTFSIVLLPQTIELIDGANLAVLVPSFTP